MLVAEDITSRFLNLMSLLSGSIPLIAIQVVALRVDDKIALHFVRVLDQTTLRTDDEYELAGGTESTRASWEAWASPDSLKRCDRILEIVRELTGQEHSLFYTKNFVRVRSPSGVTAPVWFSPRKTLVRIGGYVDDAEAWVKRFDDSGVNAGLRHGNKAVAFPLKPQEFETQGELLREFLSAALGVNDSDAE